MTSSQTTNYALPQWAKTDRLMMDDFNAAMSAIDTAIAGKCSIVTGTYTGNGSTSRSITLGFRAKALLVMAQDGTTLGDIAYYGGLALDGAPLKVRDAYGVYTNMISITDTGFKLTTPSKDSAPYLYANYNGTVFHYIAFC